MGIPTYSNAKEEEGEDNVIRPTGTGTASVKEQHPEHYNPRAYEANEPQSLAIAHD